MFMELSIFIFISLEIGNCIFIMKERTDVRWLWAEARGAVIQNKKLLVSGKLTCYQRTNRRTNQLPVFIDNLCCCFLYLVMIFVSLLIKPFFTFLDKARQIQISALAFCVHLAFILMRENSECIPSHTISIAWRIS